jgi:ribosomal protein S1
MTLISSPYGTQVKIGGIAVIAVIHFQEVAHKRHHLAELE